MVGHVTKLPGHLMTGVPRRISDLGKLRVRSSRRFHRAYRDLESKVFVWHFREVTLMQVHTGFASRMFGNIVNTRCERLDSGTNNWARNSRSGRAVPGKRACEDPRLNLRNLHFRTSKLELVLESDWPDKISTQILCA